MISFMISIPVSDAQRNALRVAEESMPGLLEKAGLAGANIFLLLIPLAVFFEEPPAAAALSKSVIKHNK